MADMVRSKEPQVLNLRTNLEWGGHTVLITGFERKPSGKIVFDVYDVEADHQEPAKQFKRTMEYALRDKKARFFSTSPEGARKEVYQEFNQFTHERDDDHANTRRIAEELYNDAKKGRFSETSAAKRRTKVVAAKAPKVGGVMIRFDADALADASDVELEILNEHVQKLLTGESDRIRAAAR